MFEKIREFLNVPKVQRIITDFELAAINTCSLLFPSPLSHACYCHYHQCIRRHLQTNGKQYLYDSDKDFHLFVKKLISIAFVPVEHVIRAFEAVCVASDIPENAQSVILYFENTWIGRQMPKREPKFRHSLWNFFDAIVQNFLTTNNAVEAWHRTFNNQFHAKKPSVLAFFDGLKREQSMTELKITQ